MILARKGRLGVSLMLDLALRMEPQKPVSLNDLASRQELSAKYIEQLLAPLKAAGLVKTVRGARGGYLLGRLPSQITLYDIVCAMEGPVHAMRPGEYHPDLVGQVWGMLGAKVAEFLSERTLTSLIEMKALGRAA